MGSKEHSRTIRRWFLPAIVSVCLLGGPALAADLSELDDPREAISKTRVAFESGALNSSALPSFSLQRGLEPALGRQIEASGFLKRHLMPRVSQQLGRMAPIHALDFERADWQRSELHDWFSGTASHYAERGLKRAARAYLIEETAVGPFMESLRVGGHRNSESRSLRATTDYGIRVSHGRPSVEMRLRSSSGTTRFGVGLDGSLRLEFRPSDSTTGRFAVGYNASESSYVLSFRHSH